MLAVRLQFEIMATDLPKKSPWTHHFGPWPLFSQDADMQFTWELFLRIAVLHIFPLKFETSQVKLLITNNAFCIVQRATGG
jgi:hypothetical protein